MDARYTALTQWIDRTLGHVDDMRPASADASFRRYFRIVMDRRSMIAMDAPPEHETVFDFVRIARRLAGMGLNVPEILGGDEDNGFLLLSDLGETLYLQCLKPSSPPGVEAERLYGDALGALVTLQTGGLTDPGFLPPYSAELLRREMELFPEWYLGRHLGRLPDVHERRLLDHAFDVLVASALEQPQVWVHRDYHSRNLMRTARNNPGILDFQDAVLGPVTYDLVSLLKDAYIAWPKAQVDEWAKGFCRLEIDSGLIQERDEDHFLRWFDLMGVQRHLKVAGIFARLNYRDSKARYLADIPRVLSYIEEVLPLYPELHGLSEIMARYGIPATA
ncbi:MAG: aminoglycoside phosphotransferase family protein [Acidiferrobacteraceae bacterium]